MVRAKNPVLHIEKVEDVIEEVEEVEEEDDDIQRSPSPPPVKQKKVAKGTIEPYNVKPKAKRVQTEAQKENTRKMIEARRVKNERIREEKSRRAEEEKQFLEEKIVKKAISIKKKEIKKSKVLDDISDDDEPVETVRNRAAPRVIEKIVYVEKQKPTWTFI